MGPLFWISGDVCTGFRNQGGSPACMILSPNSLRFTYISVTPADLLAARMYKHWWLSSLESSMLLPHSVRRDSCTTDWAMQARHVDQCWLAAQDWNLIDRFFIFQGIYLWNYPFTLAQKACVTARPGQRCAVRGHWFVTVVSKTKNPDSKHEIIYQFKYSVIFSIIIHFHFK